MVKSRVPPRGGGAVERGASSFLMAVVALVLLGLAPGAPHMARDAMSLDEAAPGPGPVRDMEKSVLAAQDEAPAVEVLFR